MRKQRVWPPEAEGLQQQQQAADPPAYAAAGEGLLPPPSSPAAPDPGDTAAKEHQAGATA